MRIVRAALRAGIAVEAGLATPADAEQLARSPFTHHILRALVVMVPGEPVGLAAAPERPGSSVRRLRQVEVRALTFDVFGTLLDWRSTMARALGESGLEADPEELAHDWRARALAATQEVNRKQRPWGSFDELHEVTLGELLDERGLELPNERRAALMRAWHQLDPWPDVPTGLEPLRQALVVAALSNANLALLVDLVRHTDLRFDCLLSAELPRVYKPDAEVYLTGVRLLGLEPDDVMMVAAHPFDLKGARSAGLRTAFIDRPLEYGPGSPSREDPEADISVADLHELAARLGPRPGS